MTLRDAVADRADMRTLVLIGSSRTRLIARAGGRRFRLHAALGRSRIMTEPAQHLGDGLDLCPARE